MRHTALWSCTHIPNIIDLSRKKKLFDLEVKGQGPNKGHYGTRHTSYGHAPTYQISLPYFERQKMLWPEQKNPQLFDLQVKGQGKTKVIMVCTTPPYGHASTYQISLTYLERQKSYGPDKLRRVTEEA